MVCAARNAEALDGAVREIEGYGAEPLAVPFDAASQDDCNVVVERAVDRFGRIDSFVRSHMVAVFGEIEKLTADELRRVRRFPAIRARAAGSASSPGRGRSGRRSGLHPRLATVLALLGIGMPAAVARVAQHNGHPREAQAGRPHWLD